MLSDEQIKHMVGRFLNWRLPEGFNPDGGISFERDYNTATPWPAKHEPVGTNLFDGVQAEAMVRHMLDGLPVSQKEAVARDEDNMPERIWAGDFNASGFGHCVVGPQGGLYAEYVRADLAAPSPAPSGEPGIKALHVLFKDMQSACANYLEPTTYIRRFPSDQTRFATEFEQPHPLHSDTQKRFMVERRNEAFINDIIWMLDGPEQRAAEAALHPTPTPVSAPVGESKVRYSRVFGNDRMEMGRSLPIELYRIGDTILVWANEGDLCFYGQEFARSPAVEVAE